MMEIGATIDVRQSSPEAAALKAGDLLKVKILEVFESQRIRVDLGCWRTVADISFPVAVGDEFWVRVQETGGLLRFQRVPTPEEAASPAGPPTGPVRHVTAESLARVRTGIEKLVDAWSRLPESGRLLHEARPALETFRGLLNPLDLESTPGAVAARLKDFCENSGLFLESRLGSALRTASGQPAAAGALAAATARWLPVDLKSCLLILRALGEGSSVETFAPDPHVMAGFKRAVSEALAEIGAAQQQLASRSSADQPFQMVHFAMPMPDDRHKLRLKIAYRRRHVGEKRLGHRAAVLLALDRVGTIRADLFLFERDLSISLFVSSPELQDVFVRHAPEVRDALAEWFDSVSVRVDVSPRTIERFIAEDWRPAGESRVDVRA